MDTVGSKLASLQTSEMLNEYLDWPGVGQVYRLERRFSWVRQGRTYKTSCEVEFGVTSLSRQQAAANKILKVRRQYWGIRDRLTLSAGCHLP